VRRENIGKVARIPSLLLVLALLAPPAAAQPTLRVHDHEGQDVVLPEPGAVTVVQFMATWCAPCHEQTKALVELHQTYAPRGVRIVAVSFDRPAEHKLLPIYVEEFAVPYPLLVGGTLAMLKGFVSNDTLPAVVIVDRDGQVFDTVMGLVPTDVLTARLDWLTSDRTTSRPPPFVPPAARARRTNCRTSTPQPCSRSRAGAERDRSSRVDPFDPLRDGPSGGRPSTAASGLSAPAQSAARSTGRSCGSR
jgi:thiol-disulfide isomerase/thioredoxin